MKLEHKRMGKLFLILLSFCALSGMAQDMKSVFIAMPDSIFPLLTKVNKEDCVDFLDSNMKAEVTNRFGNTAEMKTLTDDYVWMQTSSVSTLEMKLLPVNDSTKVICMVKTVCASACDSEVHFYASDWSKRLDTAAFLQLPSADAFYQPDSLMTKEVELAKKKADMHTLKVSLSKDDTSLAFLYTTPDYLNKEDREKLLLVLRKEPVIYQWNEGKFR